LPSTTWANMRKEYARFVGYPDIVGLNGLAWSTTTDVTTASTVVVISTELRDAGFDDFGQSAAGDDSLENLWCILLGANNLDKERRVKAYDASSGQSTLSGIPLAAESGSTDFEFHRFRPSYIRDKANDARLDVFPTLHLPITRQLFTAQSQVRYDVPAAIVDGPDRIYLYKGIPTSHANNILANGDFEDFTSGVPDSWAATTLDTAEEAVTTSPFNYVRIDGSGVRCTSQTGNVGTLLQSISSPGTHSGQRISLQIWVYCLTADVVSTAIKIGSTTHLGTAADGGLHGGGGWELLTHFEDSTVTIATLDIGISVVSTAADNTEFYIDSAVSAVGPLQEPEVVPTRLFDWDYREDVQGTTLRQNVTFKYEFPDNHILRFEGKGYLSAATEDSSTMEIAKPQNDLLYSFMAKAMYEEYGQLAPDIDQGFNRERLRVAMERMDNLMVHAQRKPRAQMTIPDSVPVLHGGHSRFRPIR
jgi:hypothetical protein